MKRKHEGRGLISTETCIRSEESNVGLFVRESYEMLLKGVKKVGIVKTENLMENEDFKKNSQNEFKNKWHEKRMYGQFVREMLGEIVKYLGNGCFKVISKCILKQRYMLHKNKH